METESENNKPMTSLVLLQRQPKYLEDVILPQLVEQSWGGEYSTGGGSDDDDSDDEESAGDGFIVGENPLFVIKSPSDC